MVSKYVDLVLDPFGAQDCCVPDLFCRKTTVFRNTVQVQVRSSVVNGHVAGIIYPQNYADSTSNFVSYYTDAASSLNISSMPTSATLTNNNLNGTNLAAYYSYARLVSLGYKFIYIGAELTAAGEFAICFANNNSVVNTVAGTDLKNAVRDAAFTSCGRAENIFEGIWLPQDQSDLQLRSLGDILDADKVAGWGVIQFCGSGFPVNTVVYQLEITATVEATVLTSVSDFIPQKLSPPMDPNEALLQVKAVVFRDQRAVCRNSSDKYERKRGSGRDISPMAVEPVSLFSRRR